MRNIAENYIARDKSLELGPTKQVKTTRQLEKSLPVDQSAVFDSSDDLNNEEFINANDPENKFVPIEEVADPDSDFLEKEQEEKLDWEDITTKKADMEEIDDAQQIEKIRKSIGDYSFKHRGSKFSNLESFHVNHDKSEMLAVGAIDGRLDHEDIKDKNEDEFELAEADNSESKRGKMIGKYEYSGKIGKIPGAGHDNLKTQSDDKKQRDKRWTIRKFLDRLN